MSTFAFAVGTITPGAGTADNASLTTATYMVLQGGTATQLNFVEEIYMGGQAASSAPLIMLLGRDSTVTVGGSALATPNSNGPTHPGAGVLTAPAVGFVAAATTQPIRSNSVSLAKKNFTFNAFGGIVRANYANTQDRFGILGNTASLGELSLSSFTGSTAAAAIGAHIIYETL
jgi:hypothetical protein